MATAFPLVAEGESTVLLPNRDAALPPVFCRLTHPKIRPHLVPHLRKVYVLPMDVSPSGIAARKRSCKDMEAPLGSDEEMAELGLLEVQHGDVVFGRPLGSTTSEHDVLLQYSMAPAHLKEQDDVSLARVAQLIVGTEEYRESHSGHGPFADDPANAPSREGRSCFGLGVARQAPVNTIAPFRSDRISDAPESVLSDRTDIFATTVDIACRAFQAHQPEVYDVLRNHSEVVNFPRVGVPDNCLYASAQINTANAVTRDSQQSLKEQMGKSGDNHIDPHDAHAVLSTMLCHPSLPTGHQGGRFHVLPLGTYFKTDKPTVAGFSSLFKHSGTPPLAPPGCTEPSLAAVRLNIILYSHQHVLEGTAYSTLATLSGAPQREDRQDEDGSADAPGAGPGARDPVIRLPPPFTSPLYERRTQLALASQSIFARDGTSIMSAQSHLNYVARSVVQIAIGVLRQMGQPVRVDADGMLAAIQLVPERGPRLTPDPWPLGPDGRRAVSPTKLPTDPRQCEGLLTQYNVRHKLLSSSSSVASDGEDAGHSSFTVRGMTDNAAPDDMSDADSSSASDADSDAESDDSQSQDAPRPSGFCTLLCSDGLLDEPIATLRRAMKAANLYEQAESIAALQVLVEPLQPAVSAFLVAEPIRGFGLSTAYLNGVLPAAQALPGLWNAVRVAEADAVLLRYGQMLATLGLEHFVTQLSRAFFASYSDPHASPIPWVHKLYAWATETVRDMPSDGASTSLTVTFSPSSWDGAFGEQVFHLQLKHKRDGRFRPETERNRAAQELVYQALSAWFGLGNELPARRRFRYALSRALVDAYGTSLILAAPLVIRMFERPHGKHFKAPSRSKKALRPAHVDRLCDEGHSNGPASQLAMQRTVDREFSLADVPRACEHVVRFLRESAQLLDDSFDVSGSRPLAHIKSSLDGLFPIKELAPYRRHATRAGHGLTLELVQTRSGAFSALLGRTCLFNSPCALDHSVVFADMDEAQGFRDSYPHLPDTEFVNPSAYGRTNHRSWAHSFSCWEAADDLAEFIRKGHPTAPGSAHYTFPDLVAEIQRLRIPTLGPLIAFLTAADLAQCGAAPMPDFSDIAALLDAGAARALGRLGLPHHSVQDRSTSYEALYAAVETELTADEKAEWRWDPLTFEHALCKYSKCIHLFVHSYQWCACDLCALPKCNCRVCYKRTSPPDARDDRSAGRTPRKPKTQTQSPSTRQARAADKSTARLVRKPTSQSAPKQRSAATAALKRSSPRKAAGASKSNK
ncbi:hypothetical protein BD626DRAFT_542385 [Schizophyllum amplum]|uniref:Uncharacterized protein n=1 Tax=Schizophyllum amplum TaxID=97359 RepID=A0A550BSJ6_9AGAR|nr:hypothetical protein BD626DRAFT_542385 [Auriculariopsis ampla]